MPLAVVGMGGLFPRARTLREYWANIKSKTDAIREVPPTHWRKEDYYDPDPKAPDKVYACRGGFLEPYDFDPSEFGLAPSALEATDPAQLFGLVAAKMALADAGRLTDSPDWDRSRVSCILGVTGTLEIVVPLASRLAHPVWRRAMEEAGVPRDRAEEALARMSDAFVPWQEASFPGLLGNVVAGRIANRFNLGGTNCVVDAACASSLSALHLASLELASRRSTMVLCGGVDTFNDIFMYACFTKTPALSPSGHARPFDAGADGTTLGEGVGVLALRRLDDARRDGDRVHAIVRGLGSSSDGRGKSIYAPSADGQRRALEEAYRVSGVDPATVELVEAHGTGTAVGDGIELSALAEVYGRSGREGSWCALGSVKSMIGHTKAAAGAAGLIKTVMALKHKVLPPTIKVERPLAPLAEGRTPFYLSAEARPWMRSAHPRRAAVSALGFGGTNFHAVLEEASPEKLEPDWDGGVELLAWSGERPALEAGLSALEAASSWDEVRALGEAGRRSFERAGRERLCLVAERGGDWRAAARRARELLAAGGKAAASAPEGVFHGTGPAGKLAVLFPGQGAQYPGMGRELFCAFPEALGALEEADADFPGPRRLSELMLPRPAWGPERQAAREAELRATEVAQPALGAAALAGWRVLSRFGVAADMAGGHSYGELVALHAAGAWGAPALRRFSRLRGELMAAGGGDRGSMLAVLAPLSALEAAVREEGLDLVVANRNAPEQNVLSGATAEISRAEKILAARGLRISRLSVAAAFHSPLVAGALEPFRGALAKEPLRAPSIPVYANSTGEPYPSDPAAARELLAGQLAAPVEFVRMVEGMHRDGARIFVECGPGARLTGLVSRVLEGKEFCAVSLDASSGKKPGLGDLARVLAQIAAAGCPADLAGWQGGAEGLRDVRPRPRLSVPLTGAAHRSTPRRAFPPRPAAPPASPAASTPAVFPAEAAALPPAAAPAFAEALRSAQAAIDALGKLQEQAASAHLLFLRGQDEAQRQVQALIERQQALCASLAGTSPPAPAAMAAAIPPAAPVPAPAPPGASAPAGEAVMAALLAIVSEKTGYPPESLQPDMDLEGDLGIDSIKRVEILSAARERLPGAPQVRPEQLGTLRTLRAVAEHLAASGEAAAARPAPSPSPAPASAAKGRAPAFVELGRAVPVLGPAGPRDAFPLKGAVAAVAGDPPLARALARELRGRGARAEAVAMEAAALPADLDLLVLAAPLRSAGKRSPWGEESESWLKSALSLARAAGLGWAARGRWGMLAAATRLDGQAGLAGSAGGDPSFGALFGLVKTAAKEWPKASCRAVDLDPALGPDEAAALLARELSFAGPVEAALGREGVRGLGLEERPLGGPGRAPLRPGDAVIVTGGARGVTAACALALAREFGVRLVLAGRSPDPGQEPDPCPEARSEAELRRELARARPGTTPKEAAARARGILAAREIRATLEALRAAGAQARYRSCDARDAAGVAAIVAETARDWGPVRGLVHGAGVIADKALLDKSPESAALVIDTKLAGLRAFLDALDPAALRAVALFSSSTARFGRAGQADYAMANEALNKAAGALAARLPACRVAALGWGPWDGGMVDASLKALFAAEGVEAIALEAGAERLLEELKRGAEPETVVLARGKAAPAGGAAPALAPVFERTLDLESVPILRAHRLAGRAVVPLALSAEWLGHAALHAHPGMLLAGWEGLRAARALAVPEGAKVPLRALAGPGRRRPEGLEVPVELRGEDGVLYADATALLADRRPEPPAPAPAPAGPPAPGGAERAYREDLFHGPELRVVREIPVLGPGGFELRAAAAEPPAAWMARPPRDRWIADPAALDALFQGLIVWACRTLGAPCLPARVARLRLYGEFPPEGALVRARARSRGEGAAEADADFLDEAGRLVARLEGLEAVVDPGLRAAFRGAASAPRS